MALDLVGVSSYGSGGEAFSGSRSPFLETYEITLVENIGNEEMSLGNSMKMDNGGGKHRGEHLLDRHEVLASVPGNLNEINGST